MNWSVVVPTIRPEQFRQFEKAWTPLFEKYNVDLIVVDDMPTPFRGGHLSQRDVPSFIPRKTDMIRSWGFYKAWEKGSTDFILTLDDDVVPYMDVFQEYQKEFEKGRPLSSYLSTGSLTTSGLEMRGFPYKDRSPKRVGIQYGSWRGVLDYDAATQLSNPRKLEHFHPVNIQVPKGVPTTCCIMNCAFRVENTPMMWQLPMLKGRYNRTGDIWSGLIQKKVLDHLGQVMMINGKASVEHNRASEPFNNLEKEQPGLKLNEDLWENLEEGDFETVADSAYRYFKKNDKEYAEHFRKCRDQWLALFS